MNYLDMAATAQVPTKGLGYPHPDREIRRAYAGGAVKPGGKGGLAGGARGFGGAGACGWARLTLKPC